MKTITIYTSESGTRSENVEYSDAESHISAGGAYATESELLLTFIASDDIPNSLEDGDGDVWNLLDKGCEEGADFYVYEIAQATIYAAELNDGGKSAEFATIEAAIDYIAANFRTDAADLGTWDDEDGKTLVWMTQDAADAAEDNSDVIATITAS